MVILDQSVVNIKSQHANFKLEAIIGDRIFGEVNGDKYVVQCTNGFTFREIGREDESEYAQIKEAYRQISVGKTVVTPHEVLAKACKIRGYHLITVVKPKFELERQELTGFARVKAKLRKEPTEYSIYKEVESEPVYQWTYDHDGDICYEIAVRKDVQVVDQFMEVNGDKLKDFLVERGLNVDDQLLADLMLEHEGIREYFETRAKDESSPEILFTKGELWQVSIIKAFLSQQESADKLTKMLKAELEWQGSVDVRSGIGYKLRDDTLEDLITKYAHE